jgi:hypothetical protein
MTSKAHLLAAALVAALAAAAPLRAQNNPISCPTSFQITATGACSGTLPSGKSTDQGELRVNVRAEGGAVVRFRVVSGGGSVVPDSVALASSGSVGTFWSRPHAATNAVVIVEVVTKNGNAVRALELNAPALAPTEEARLKIHSGDGQEWFESRGLRFPLVTEIVRGVAGDSIRDSDVCARYKVIYHRRAGALADLPDTVPARIASADIGRDPKRRGCFAFGNASLGAGAGVRYVDADLVGPQIASGADNSLFPLQARALPRFVTGIGVTQIRRVSVLEAGTERKGKITRVRADSSTIEVDTTLNDAGSVGRDGGTEPVLVVGLTSPIPIQGLDQRLNVMIGVDPARPSSNIFGGFSLLNLFWPKSGSIGEALPIGVYGLVNYQRIKVIENAERCASNSECAESTRAYRGFSLMVTYDAGDALTALVKKLTG